MVTFIDLLVMAVLTILEYSHKIKIPTYMYFIWIVLIMISAVFDYIFGKKLLEFIKNVKRIAEKDACIEIDNSEEPNIKIGFENGDNNV